MEITMKTIMGALATAALLVGAAAPASAEMDVDRMAGQLMRMAGSDTVKYDRQRRDVPRYYEHDSSKLPFGSGEWWRQVEREQFGRRR
jgi:hypothetical protein